MIHPNFGFKDLILDALPGGGFRLLDSATRKPACSFSFTNRKAARNWANGRGFRLIERVPSNRSESSTAS